mgnify:CR=1 FL=1
MKPAAVAAGVHAYQLGTDARTTWYTLLTLCLVAVGSYPLALRWAAELALEYGLTDIDGKQPRPVSIGEA